MILIQLSSFFLRSFLNSFLGAGRCPAKANPARLEIGGFYWREELGMTCDLLVAPIPHNASQTIICYSSLGVPSQ